MGSLKENINITWNNFESRLSHSFADIRNHGQFLDVTLAVEAADGSLEALQAHKVVLSACSPVLRALLTKQSALVPNSASMAVMLYLQGISAPDLKHVLEFIYKGSVSLAQHELNDFLAVAKSLQIPLDEEPGRERPAAKPKRSLSPGRGGKGKRQRKASPMPERQLDDGDTEGSSRKPELNTGRPESGNNGYKSGLSTW